MMSTDVAHLEKSEVDKEIYEEEIGLVTVKIREISRDSIVFSDKVRHYCSLPYPRHPRGCPNYNNNPLCPPNSRIRKDIITKYNLFYLVRGRFNIVKFMEATKIKHPQWSEAQQRNCLYWQNTVRKIMSNAVKKSNIRYAEVLGAGGGHNDTQSMESSGIYVFGTLLKNKIKFDARCKKEVVLVWLLCAHKHKDLFSFLEIRRQ